MKPSIPTESRWPIERRWLARNPGGDRIQLTTPELAEHRAVCLLGAAGAGKTFEIDRLAEVETSRGCCVSRQHLGKLAASGAELRRRLDELSENATDDTVILLDSLDESMIPLRNVTGVLEGWIIERCTERPRLRIACRSPVWPTLLSRALGNVYGEDGFLSAELLPLEPADVRIVAESEGIDPEGFLKSVDEAGVIVFAQQPLTLSLLISEFQTAGSLPKSRRELFDRSITRLCLERDDRLERGTARDIEFPTVVDSAERLAAILLLSGHDAVHLAVESSSEHDALSADVLTTLAHGGGHQFTQEHVRDLSSVGLFGGDDPRSFRFFHRQLSEYLAGRRLASLPLHQAKAMLSRDAGWDKGVAGPLHETAAAAAMCNDDLAEWIAVADPEVIGRSDIASPALRRTALLHFLQLFRDGRLTDMQVHRDQISFNGFRYEDSAQDLRPILQERGPGLEDIQACAIEFTQQWELSILSDSVADLVLDTEVPLGTRHNAAWAMLKVGSASEKKRLIPLIHGVQDDENEDLKGLALRCNWPTNLSTVELLNVLTTPARSNYLGAYEGFLYELDRSGFDASDEPAQGIQWAISILEPGHWHSSLQRIAGRICFRSLDDVDNEIICSHLISLILRAGDWHAEPFFMPSADELEYDSNDCAAISERFARDPALRRGLIDGVAEREADPLKASFAIMSIRGLLHEDDFEWLIDRAVEDRRPGSHCYAELASRLPWTQHPNCLERWLEVHELEVIARHFSMPLSVEIESEPADRMRQLHEMSRIREPEPASIMPPPNERVKILLERCDDDPHWFGHLTRELTLTEHSRRYSPERFLTKSPGWDAASQSTRDRVVADAKRLLEDCDDIALKCKRVSISNILGDGAMPAMLLLLELDRDWLESRPQCWWETWSWYIVRELHLNLLGESNGPKANLLGMLHANAPKSLGEIICRLARSKTTASLLESTFEVLDNVIDESLDADLCAFIRDPKARGEPLSHLMHFCLRRRPKLATSACLNRLTVHSPCREGVPSVRAAVAMLCERPAETWREVLVFVNKRRDLASHVFAQFAHLERRRGADLLERMGDTRLGQFLEQLFDLFPPENDPRHEGAHAVGPRDSAVFLRTTLLNHLTERGTAVAAAAVSQLESRFGRKYSWLRRSRAEAERRADLSMWTPLQPKVIADLLSDADRRLIRSADDLLEFVAEAATQYGDQLQHGTPRDVEDLWDIPSGAPPTPKHEKRVSDKLCGAILQYCNQYAVSAGRELQLRRRIIPKSAGGEQGQETDIFVSVPGTRETGSEPIAVVVEVKRSQNREAKSGLRDQLVDRYLVQNNLTHGAFIVAYFDAPDLSQHARPQWSSIEEAREDLQAQANVVNGDEKMGVVVRSLVLDSCLQ